MNNFRNCILAGIGSSIITAGAIHSQGAEVLMGVIVVVLSVLPYNPDQKEKDLD